MYPLGIVLFWSCSSTLIHKILKINDFSVHRNQIWDRLAYYDYKTKEFLVSYMRLQMNECQENLKAMKSCLVILQSG